MERYVCVHGHFYQPPRENPWLEAIEQQDSAYPYHDWNERITAECYAPNGASRILDAQGRIAKIVNNYARMSFNMGPTLLAWMQDRAPAAYAHVIEADRESAARFSGHGSALAQNYNHLIMPLANSRDKRTQVAWGVRDFEHRFGRKPEGMWLAETAVDLESLDLLAEHGIRFTILAPGQASRVRRIGSRAWKDVSGARIDPTRAYLQHLPSGRNINLFFYDGPISHGIAFEGILRSGEVFAARLMTGFSDQRTWPQLVNVATDGETYGHHHRFGDMALAYALEHIDEGDAARLTNYAEFLERHPPDHQVDIFENTSWSCAHGVERWRSDCGCNTGARPEWHQGWRRPLRDALDWLRDTLAPLYQERASAFFQDPWRARDDYIDVILNRDPDNADAFFARHDTRALDDGDRVEALKLLELQRHALLMYTSCGWFFDELSGIETVQVIQYAGRAVQLATQLFGPHFEPEFVRRLAAAKSNIPEFGDGARIYERFVKPAMLDLPSVGAHYAVSSLFEPYAEQSSVYCYDVTRDDYHVFESGRARAAVGRARVRSRITGESQPIAFGVLHFGDHNLNGGVSVDLDDEHYSELVAQTHEAMERADLSQVLRVLDDHFSGLTYSLKSLFRDEQRKVLRLVLEPLMAEAESLYREFYERNAPLMRAITDIGAPVPRRLLAAAQIALDIELERAARRDEIDADRFRGLLQEAATAGVRIDEEGLGYALAETVLRLARQAQQRPEDIDALIRWRDAACLASSLAIKVDLWNAQNVYWDMLQEWYPACVTRAQRGDEGAAAARDLFVSLGECLNVSVPRTVEV